MSGVGHNGKVAGAANWNPYFRLEIGEEPTCTALI
jgi:hypothetical protein